jgi:hypothetical protein
MNKETLRMIGRLVGQSCRAAMRPIVAVPSQLNLLEEQTFVPTPWQT